MIILTAETRQLIDKAIKGWKKEKRGAAAANKEEKQQPPPRLGRQESAAEDGAASSQYSRIPDILQAEPETSEGERQKMGP